MTLFVLGVDSNDDNIILIGAVAFDILTSRYLDFAEMLENNYALLPLWAFNFLFLKSFMFPFDPVSRWSSDSTNGRRWSTGNVKYRFFFETHSLDIEYGNCFGSVKSYLRHIVLSREVDCSWVRQLATERTVYLIWCSTHWLHKTSDDISINHVHCLNHTTLYQMLEQWFYSKWANSSLLPNVFVRDSSSQAT